MTVPGRYAQLVALTLVAVLAAACSDSAFSPSSPSGVGGRSAPSGASGAVITGSVSGMTFATTSSDFGTRATTPVTVTVVGTSISTSIDGSGRFTLTNVPTGDVQLKFAGTGLDATLTLKNVQPGDRIDIRVRVTDSSVRIEAERRMRGRGDEDDDDDDEDETEFKGTVAALNGTCPTIAFTLSGVTIKTNSATRFDGACNRVQNNTRVEVHGQRQSDGSIQATRVEIDD